MKNKAMIRFYLLSVLGVLLAAAYPLYMGVRVVWDMLATGTVLKENYPKYIIPYTPIALAVLLGVVLIPLLFRLCKKAALPIGSLLSVAVFFAVELLFEKRVVVTATGQITLEDWQMFMCYVPPEGYYSHKMTPIEILMGEYSPAFKLHFYLISIVLILALLNCLYGFYRCLQDGCYRRVKALILQSISTALFLGLCILACFTAFWRDGSLTVSALSASLMAAFFILMGLTAGIYIGSLLLRKKRLISVGIPAVTAAVMTALMYVGEAILLHGNLYRFGSGLLFEGLPVVLLAPIDILIVLGSGIICAALLAPIAKKAPIEAPDPRTHD